MKKVYNKKDMRKNQLNEIVKELHTFQNISNSIIISKRAIQYRAEISNLVISKRISGTKSLVTLYKNYFINMIIKLSKI